MMASFLPVIVSKTNKEKYAFYYTVSQIDINPEKTQKMTSDVPTCGCDVDRTWDTLKQVRKFRRSQVSETLSYGNFKF